MRKRAMPYVGQEVAIVRLAVVHQGVVEAIAQEGRTLQVRSEQGETLTFTLDRATGGFTLAGGQTSARLRFIDE